VSGDSGIDHGDDPAAAPHDDLVATLGSVGRVLVGIRALDGGLHRYRNALSAQLGLGLPEITTLTQLFYEQPVRAGEVAAHTGLAMSSVTALLGRLERRGYLRRVRPPHNQRIVLVQLTPTGREVAESMFRPIVPLLHIAAAEPGAPDPQSMAQCLQRLGALLNELAVTTSREQDPNVR
jgi:DNA-binding MarR family transcriptional regulator